MYKKKRKTSFLYPVRKNFLGKAKFVGFLEGKKMLGKDN